MNIVQYFLLFGMTVFFTACVNVSRLSNKSILSKTPFGVCYAKVTPDQVRNYKLVIVEPDFYTKAEVKALKQTGTTIIAYITLGEVDRNRWYYQLLEEHGFLGINQNWGSSYINLEKEEVREILLERMLPEVMAKGFDGLFLDTIDAVAPYSDRRVLEPYMVELIKDIRVRHPEIYIIQNAGLFLLSKTRSAIDAVVIEDVASGYDFYNQKYYLKSREEFLERVKLVTSTIENFDVPVFVIDFAESFEGISEIKSRLDTLNVPYFISNIELSELPIRPETVANKLRRN